MKGKIKKKVLELTFLEIIFTFLQSKGLAGISLRL
jgi:hypothetical protein